MTKVDANQFDSDNGDHANTCELMWVEYYFEHYIYGAGNENKDIHRTNLVFFL